MVLLGNKIRDGSLYLVITEEYGNGRRAYDIAEAAIRGGVDIIQMREKDKARDELVRMGKDLALLCRKNKVLFIVNDDPVLAKEVGADGVHLGQDDIKKYPLRETRKVLSESGIIGVSTHSVEQFERVNEEELDYIAFGPIFETKTKGYFLGSKDIGKVTELAQKPVFFIGGINLSNIDELLEKGAKNIALIRGITEAEDMVSTTRKYKDRVKL